jgi:hypothetical protein
MKTDIASDISTDIDLRAFDPDRDLPAMAERGMDEAVLGVDTENPSGALGLYEGFGFRPKRTWIFLRKPFED